MRSFTVIHTVPRRLLALFGSAAGAAAFLPRTLDVALSQEELDADLGYGR